MAGELTRKPVKSAVIVAGLSCSKRKKRSMRTIEQRVLLSLLASSATASGSILAYGSPISVV